MKVILLGANNPRLVGEVVGNLAQAGNTVIVEAEFVSCMMPECPKCGGGTLLARIEYKKPVNEEKRAARKAWNEKIGGRHTVENVGRETWK